MKRDKKETIFALSTPYGQSAIAVIRISGTMSKNIAKKFCQIKRIEPRKAIFSKFYDKEKNYRRRNYCVFQSSFFFYRRICLKFNVMVQSQL